ncbi:MAG TPA: hypothetical protein VIL74_00645 [Pyrinomonadaceae bacterium]|jgi:hypothetical protein
MNCDPATINIEESKFYVQLREFDEIAEYLDLGWMLTGRYVVGIGGDGRPDPAPRHILVWPKDGTPSRPEKYAGIRETEMSRAAAKTLG